VKQSTVICWIKYHASISEHFQVQVGIQPEHDLMPGHDQEGLPDRVNLVDGKLDYICKKFWRKVSRTKYLLLETANLYKLISCLLNIAKNSSAEAPS